MRSLKSPYWDISNEYTQHIIIEKKIEKTSLKYPCLSPDLAPWLTLSGSTYQFLEQISNGPKDVQAVEV